MSSQSNFLANPNPPIPVHLAAMYVNDDFRNQGDSDRVRLPTDPYLCEVYTLPLLKLWLSRCIETVNDMKIIYGMSVEELVTGAYLEFTVRGRHRYSNILIERITNSATVKQWRANILSGELSIEPPCSCRSCYKEQAQGHGPRMGLIVDFRNVTHYHGQRIEWTPRCNMPPYVKSGLSADLPADCLMVDIVPAFSDPVSRLDPSKCFNLRQPLASVDTLPKLRAIIQHIPELLKILAARNIHFVHDFFGARLLLSWKGKKHGDDDGDDEPSLLLDNGDGPTALIARDDRGQYYVRDRGDNVEPMNGKTAAWLAKYANSKASQDLTKNATVPLVEGEQVVGDIVAKVIVVFHADNATDKPGATALIKQNPVWREQGQTEEDYKCYLAELIALRERDVTNDDDLGRTPRKADGKESLDILPMPKVTAVSRLFAKGDHYLSETLNSGVRQQRIQYYRSIHPSMQGAWEPCRAM